MNMARNFNARAWLRRADNAGMGVHLSFIYREPNGRRMQLDEQVGFTAPFCLDLLSELNAGPKDVADARLQKLKRRLYTDRRFRVIALGDAHTEMAGAA